jgi:3-oxoacyl-[acyl-carrier-protein] synthase III
MSRITAIDYYLPEQVLTNDDLSRLYSNWTAEKIFEKTGIRQRHVCSEKECASDLAEKAGLKLFAEQNINPMSIDFVILATQSPDYLLPTTACILQDKLGIPTTAGAFDFNLGCSAYIYGLALAKGLIESGTAGNILLLMAETYTKHIHPMDKSVRTIFGDGAAATVVSRSEKQQIGEFVLGTNGAGYKNLIVPVGGMRDRRCASGLPEMTDDSGNVHTDGHLYMDGTEIFNFTISAIPKIVQQCIVRNHVVMEDIDLFVFHQANGYMLNVLRKILRIPSHKFFVDMEDCGNTVSASIPIALRRAANKSCLKRGAKVMLVGFGVGLSYGATVVIW